MIVGAICLAAPLGSLRTADVARVGIVCGDAMLVVGLIRSGHKTLGVNWTEFALIESCGKGVADNKALQVIGYSE